MFESPSRMSGSGRLALTDVQEWSGVPSRWPGVVVSPLECPAVVGSPFRMSGYGREAFPDVRE